MCAPGKREMQKLLYTGNRRFEADLDNINVNTGRESVDNTSYGRTMTLAKGGQRKNLTECIHDYLLTIIY